MVSLVGWRDRDWGKFTPDEWDRFLGAQRRDPFATQTRPGDRPLSDAPRKVVSTRRGLSWLTGALAVIGALIAFASQYQSLRRPTPTVHLVPAPAPTSNVVHVHWRVSDLAYAATAGEICLMTQAHDRVCAAYAIGEKPADALTRQLLAEGLSVESG